MISLQTSTCVLFLLSVILQCQSAALPVVEPGQQGVPNEQANALQSGHTSIEEKVENLAQRFGEENVKQCCRNSLPHYESTQNCYEKPRGMTDDENSPCFKAFRQCCLQVTVYSQRTSSLRSRRSVMEPGHQTEVEPEEQTQGEPGKQTQGEPGQQTQGEPGQQTQGEPGQQTQGEPGQQIQGEPGQQTQGEPRQQIQGEPGQQIQGEPGQQIEEEPGRQTEGGLEELTEEEPDQQTEEELAELLEEEQEEQTEEAPEEQTEEEPEEQTEEEPEELTEEEPEEELIEIDPEDFPGEESQPLLSLQLSLKVSPPLDDEEYAGLEDDQTSQINPEDQSDLEELLSGPTSLEKK